jgi:hypothetical protein
VFARRADAKKCDASSDCLGDHFGTKDKGRDGTRDRSRSDAAPDLEHGREDHDRLQPRSMNKGLEVIEARWLFGFGPDEIDISCIPNQWCTR